MAIKKFKDYIYIIQADLYRYDGATGVKNLLKKYIREPGFRYTFWMRTAGFLNTRLFLKVPYWLACFQLHRLEIKYGIIIPHTTEIGSGLFIGHFGGIVVNHRVSIGRNCNLSHGVTIGQKNRGKHKGYPKIGNSVFIGPGVSIIGSVSIGSNVAIGANAVVVHDVSNNEVVVGNPASKVSDKGATKYINYTLDD